MLGTGAAGRGSAAAGRGVDEAVDDAGRVVGEVEAAVGAGDDVDGTTPSLAPDEPAGGEVLDGGRSPSAARGLGGADAHDLVAGGHRAVPGAVEGDEEIALVVARELAAR